MRKLVGCLSLLFFTATLFGQEKQTVHSIIVEWHEMDWYKTQQELWKKEIDMDKRNGEAWINYYGAVRALRISSYEDQKQFDAYNELGHKIAKEAYENIPESFEGNYIMYWDGSLGNNDERYLLKAYSLKPEDPRVLLDMLIRAEIKRDKSEFTKIAKKLFEINRMPAGALTWAYNSLTEMSQNGILFTAGDNDTYALWIVQEAMNYRKDVMIMNTSMIRMTDYREQLFKEKGLESFKEEITTVNEDRLFPHIFNNKAGIPVHVSGSAIGQFNDTVFNDKLYLTGLTYLYSKENIENIAVIKRNFEKRFLLDHLTKSFSFSIGDLDSRIKNFYLPGLIKLYKHSLTADELDRISYYKSLIDSISKELDMEEEVQKALQD